MRVNLDFETRSSLDLRRVGLYRYAAHADTQVVCAAYAVDGGEVKGWRNGEPPPEEMLRLAENGADFVAWNAQFERVVWRDVLRRQWCLPDERIPPLRRWHCTMALGALHGLPLSLADAAHAVGLAQGKDSAGRELMLRMSRPRAYDSSGAPVWWEDESRMSRLLAYCAQDVRTEMGVAERLTSMPKAEVEAYYLDQIINERGVGLDRELLSASLSMADLAARAADAELGALTGGEVVGVGQVAAITRWIKKRGVDVDGIDAPSIDAALARDIPGDVAQVLRLRREAAKSSVAKLEAMRAYCSRDGRMRGMLQFSGAATGRWSGRGPQPHNFPRGTVPNAETWIPAVLRGDIETIDHFYPPLEVLSSLLRAHLAPAEGKRFLAGDFAAIEARVLAWLAGQGDLLALFAAGQDVYRDMAAKIYGVPAGGVSKKQRQVGKAAILGLGFQMGPTKFVSSCANIARIEIDEEFGASVVATYRKANSRIAALWAAIDEAAVLTVESKDAHFVAGAGGKLRFDLYGAWLRLRLPSGRYLYYATPQVTEEETPWGGTRKAVSVHRWDGIRRRWLPRKMYGGLWTENAVQATARDLLAQAMLRVEQAGYEVVLTVHDEIVAEMALGEGSVEEFAREMVYTPEWVRGCPLSAEAWEGERYGK